MVSHEAILILSGAKTRKGETPTGSYAEHSRSTDSDPTSHLGEELLELGDVVDQRTSPFELRITHRWEPLNPHQMRVV